MTTSIAWPTGLPLPLRTGYGYQSSDLTQRTDFALGARVRQLYSDGPEPFSVSVILNATEWALFEGWYRHTLKQGALWFLLGLFAAGTLDVREVRISGRLSRELIGINHARITFTLETRAGTALSQSYYEALAAYNPDTLGADLQALENFVNG